MTAWDTCKPRLCGCSFYAVACCRWYLLGGTPPPALGSVMVFCMQDHIPVCSKEQPLLRAAKVIYDNLDLKSARNDKIGAYMVLPAD